jgi:hypothetical protein
MLEDDPSLPRSTVERQLQSKRISRSIVFGQQTEETTNRSGRFRNRGRGRYEIGQAQEANNKIMEFLYQGIKPLSIWWVIFLLSIWWVIFLLTTLAILLGPLDYKLLKRKGRLPLTWLTCTFWIALFTVGAYYGVQALRGGDMELRVVSVLDGIENTDHTWSTDYCGLFASDPAVDLPVQPGGGRQKDLLFSARRRKYPIFPAHQYMDDPVPAQ